MREGNEHPAGLNARLRCPLFLFSEETVGDLEELLRDLRGGGYTPLSLRELFRCRRGLQQWPVRPCGILFWDVSFSALQGVLTLLDRWETPVSLFCRAPYDEREAEALRSSQWLSFYGDADAADELVTLLPDGKDLHIAAFCETLDARAVAFLREKRIWMAVTVCAPIGSVPGGVDVLHALPVRQGNHLPELLARWHQSLTPQAAQANRQEAEIRVEEPQETPQEISGVNPRAVSVILPLASHAPVSDLPLAARLSILGATPEHMEQVLATTDWNPVFDPSDGSYRLRPFWNALAEETLEVTTPAEFRRLLEEGSYPFIQTQAFRVPCRSVERSIFHPGGLLLFGYDGERDVFLGMTALRPGGYDRANFRSRTLEAYCEAPCAVTSLTPDRSAIAISSEAAKEWTDAVQEALRMDDGAYLGWGASVAFANRVSGGGTVSAASLRAFLEERRLAAFRLQYYSEREKLYMEPLDRYRALLETEGNSALQELQERELPEEETLLRMGTLLQQLLNTEALCRRAFSEELERMRALRRFQVSKTAKKNKIY